jgi:serine phosphatase RsbU (regulator of sigma subunit)
VTEAFNGEGQMFGDERLHELVCQHGDSNAQMLVTQIFDSVIEFAGAAPQSDDITLAVMAWRPSTAHSTPG